MGPKKSKTPAAPPPTPVPQENYLNPNSSILFFKECTMEDDMKQKAVDTTREALHQFNTEREIATHIKQSFELEYGPYWQCMVGRDFGSYVSYDTDYIFFYFGKVGVLLYKNGEED